MNDSMKVLGVSTTVFILRVYPLGMEPFTIKQDALDLGAAIIMARRRLGVASFNWTIKEVKHT